MRPISLSKVMAEKFNTAELTQLCTDLGVDIEDFSGGKTSKITGLIQYMQRHGSRTDQLLDRVKSYHPELELTPYLYMLIEEHFNAAEIGRLCQTLKLDCTGLKLDAAGLIGYDANKYIQTERALALQAFMTENGRFADLVQAVAQIKPQITLTIFQQAAPAAGHPEEGSDAEKQHEPDQVKPAIAYENFEIHIGPNKGDNTYRLYAQSFIGETEKNIWKKLPVDDEEFDDLSAYLRGLIARSEDAEKFGQRLRQFLFTEDSGAQQIRDLYLRSLSGVKEKGLKGLRVRLHIGYEESVLSQLPWEYCASDKSYMALNEATPVVRYMPVADPPKPMTIPDTVRILLVMASPSNQAALDVAAEEDWVRQSLKKLEANGRVAIHVLPHATRLQLYESFTAFDPHILHFVGHGALEEAGGAIILEDDDGAADLVSAKTMQVLLQDSHVRLVILSACETAAHGENEAIIGLAPRLVWAGIPAVIAMQFVVPDKIAIAFMRYFYTALAAGSPIDLAITKARKGAYIVNNEIFWAIPVLYLRAPDGVIWQ